MITCPFCNNLVEVAENQSHAHLYDDEPDDFKCPIQVEYTTIHGVIKESHYARRTNQGWYPEHISLIMPFSVIWTKGPNKIEVTLWHAPPLNGEVYYQGVGDYQEFIRITKKFNNLRAFA